MADIIGPDGKSVAKESVGGSYDAANARSSPFRFKPGKAPQGPGEVAIDAGTASKKHYKVGDSIVVAPLGKKHTYKISGRSYGSVDTLGFASIAVWAASTLRPCWTAGAATTWSRSPQEGHVVGCAGCGRSSPSCPPT